MNIIGTTLASGSAQLFDFSSQVLEKIGAGSRDRTGILSLEVLSLKPYPSVSTEPCADVPGKFPPCNFKEMQAHRHTISPQKEAWK